MQVRGVAYEAGTVLVDERPSVDRRTARVVSVGDDTITLRWDGSDRDVLWPLPLPVGVRIAFPWEF